MPARDFLAYARDSSGYALRMTLKHANSGLKLAALYGLIPNELRFCGPRQRLLRKFIKGKITATQILPVLKQFEAAYSYYQLIAQKNKIKTGPFNKKVVEAYWIGNKLLNKITADDLRELIIEKFSKPGLLSKEAAVAKAKRIPANAKPHHSFHVLVIGSITGRVNFESDTKLKDVCRVGWGRITKKFKVLPLRVISQRDKSSKFKVEVKYQPLVGEKKIILGKPIKKEIIWDKNLIPKIETGDWISFHWNHAIQILTTSDVANLQKYTLNTLKTLNEKN